VTFAWSNGVNLQKVLRCTASAPFLMSCILNATQNYCRWKNQVDKFNLIFHQHHSDGIAAGVATWHGPSVSSFFNTVLKIPMRSRGLCYALQKEVQQLTC
jgi:hypothetical protein